MQIFAIRNMIIDTFYLIIEPVHLIYLPMK
jgi:hypothetical protein